MAALLTSLLVVGCAGPGDIEPSTRTVVGIASNSEWPVPTGFNVLLPLTHERVTEIARNDPGTSSDLPEFTMLGDVEVSGETERVLVAVYADEGSGGARATEVLRSWIELLIEADFSEPVVSHRNGLLVATSRGQAQGPTRDSPRGVILVAISEAKTERVWRLMCSVSSEVVSDAVAQLCERIWGEVRPTDHVLPSQ